MKETRKLTKKIARKIGAQPLPSIEASESSSSSDVEEEEKKKIEIFCRKKLKAKTYELKLMT